MPADNAHLAIRPGDQLSGGGLSSWEAAFGAVQTKISYYNCLFLCQGQLMAVFR
jgi:hypothetical protein